MTAIDFQLSRDDLNKLVSKLEKSHDYEEMRNKSRAATLCCAQELINETKTSAFDKFKKEERDEDTQIALAIALDYLKKNNLVCTAAVLEDEYEKGLFQNGDKLARELAGRCDVDGGDLMSTIVKAATN